jgi:hypothetical protein
MRIGLNSGPVVVGAIGDDLRMDYTAIGDTTNLAARMENMAAAGTILVSGYAHRLARDYFQFEALGEVEIKGREKFQKTYELLRATEVVTRIEAAAAKGLTRFVGRTAEMEALKAALEKARDGSGQVVGNRKAARVCAIDEAKTYFDEAMGIIDILPDTDLNQQRRISLLVNQSIVYELLLNFPGYHALLTEYESVAAKSGNQELLGAFHTRLGHCEWWFGKFGQSIQNLSKGPELSEAAADAENAAYAYMLLEWWHLFRGEENLSETERVSTFCQILKLAESSISVSSVQAEVDYSLNPESYLVWSSEWILQVLEKSNY